METMFGVLVAGRAVQTQATQVPPNKFVFSVSDASNVHTVAVFLTGTLPLPDGFGASVWVAWPPDFSSWRFLGFLSAAKPSAVFRIRGDSSSSSVESSAAAQVGISVEPLDAIEATMAQLQAAQGGAALSTQQLAFEERAELPRKLVQNFYDFAVSYATRSPQAAAGQSSEWFPAWVLTKWFQNVSARLQRDPQYFSSH